MKTLCCIAVLLHLVANCLAQDPNICPTVTSSGVKMPQLVPAVAGGPTNIVVAYEKKAKSITDANYKFQQSGTHTYSYTPSTGKPNIRESIRVLRIDGNFKHVFDYDNSEVLIMNMNDAFDPNACQVQKYQDYATLQDSISYLVGFDKLYQPAVGPISPFFMNIEAAQDPDETITHNDIPSTKYTSCYFDVSKKLTVLFTWWFQRGDGIPVIPVAVGVQYSTSIGGQKYDIEWDFFNFQMPVLLLESPFEIITFYKCDKRTARLDPKGLTDAFSFDSEVVVKSDDRNAPIELVAYSDQVDRETNISMRVISVGQQGTVHIETTTSYIFDTVSGVTFIIDDQYGSCTMKYADPDDYDALWSHLLNPSDLLKPKRDWVYSGLKMYREMFCNVWVYDVYNANYKVNVRYELYIAMSMPPRVMLPVQYMPVAMFTAVPKGTANRKTMYQQIFNYDANNAIISDFDVSPCFRLESQRNFVFTFTKWADGATYPNLVKDAFTRYTAKIANVSPVRITLVKAESTDNNYITFTLLDPATVKDAKRQTSTADAVTNLQNAYESGVFSFSVNLPSGKVTMKPTAFVEVSRRTPLNWFRGYSGGDMAAVCVSMLLGGLVIAVLIFYFGVARFYNPAAAGTSVNVQ